MTAIAPNTNIKILTGVPLDDTYDHTIYFESTTDQYNYFNSKAKYSLTRQMYQRVNRGWIRVNYLADNLYDCNYIMFQNESHGNKWFYAFIKSVEYVNESVSEIEFEIDVMQTWHFDYTLKPCWVDREHSQAGQTDSLYTAEPLDPGTVMYNTYTSVDLNEQEVMILYSEHSGGGYRSGYLYNTYMGIRHTAYLDPSNPASIDQIIDTHISNNDKIISIYQYPIAFRPSPDVTEAVTINQTIARPNNVSGYTPNNHKLFFYPYSFIRVSPQDGKYQDYMYEYFSDETPIKFRLSGMVIPSVTIAIYPLNYKETEICYEEKMLMNNFPQCMWTEDNFTQWWSVAKYQLCAEVISKAVSLSIMKGEVSSRWASAGAAGTKAMARSADTMEISKFAQGQQSLNNLSTSIAENALEAWATPNNSMGNVSDGNANIAFGEQKILFYKMGISRARARTIDDYFTRYGYATMKNKVPNRNVRPYWCYTKTQGCTIVGNVPADHESLICEIYNHGLTFWKYDSVTGVSVGDYTKDNRLDIDRVE